MSGICRNVRNLQECQESGIPATVQLDNSLFQGYSSVPNWNPATQVMAWFNSVRDKEVPPQVRKEIFESFIPAPDFQPLFAPAQLPKAIHDRLHSASKYLRKVPRLVNEHLSKAQKELVIANKPLVEMLSF